MEKDSFNGTMAAGIVVEAFYKAAKESGVLPAKTSATHSRKISNMVTSLRGMAKQDPELAQALRLLTVPDDQPDLTVMAQAAQKLAEAKAEEKNVPIERVVVAYGPDGLVATVLDSPE